MGDSITDLEMQLCRMHHKDFSLLTGNATSAISMIFQALNIKNRVIGIPNNVCTNVALAVNFSDNYPFYLDICNDEFGIDPDVLEKNADKLSAVIAVHSYGVPCEIQKIQKICKKYDLLLIEDIATSYGATIEGEPVGSFGDFSVASFGAGKIIDVGHGGVILSNNNQAIQKIRKRLDGLPHSSLVFEKKIESLSAFHTDIYNCFFSTKKHLLYQYQEQSNKIKKYFFYKFNDEYVEIIENKILSLRGNIDSRVKNYNNLRKAILELGIKGVCVPTLKKGASPWRLVVFVSFNRDKLLRYFLNMNIKVSSWNPSTNLFFRDGVYDVKTPVCDKQSMSILNFWIDSCSYNEEYLEKIVLGIKDNCSEG